MQMHDCQKRRNEVAKEAIFFDVMAFTLKKASPPKSFQKCVTSYKNELRFLPDGFSWSTTKLDRLPLDRIGEHLAAHATQAIWWKVLNKKHR